MTGMGHFLPSKMDFAGTKIGNSHEAHGCGMIRRPQIIRWEIEAGLAGDRLLFQGEWEPAVETRRGDKLVADGKAAVSPWRYRDNFQCSMRGIVAAQQRVAGVKELRIDFGRGYRVYFGRIASNS